MNTNPSPNELNSSRPPPRSGFGVRNQIKRTTSHFLQPEQPPSSLNNTQSVISQPKPKEYYYLIKNLEKLRNPQFFRQNTIISFTEDFLKEKFQKYFNKDQTDEEKARILEEISSKFPEFEKVFIEWITISNTSVDIEYVYILCKIQLTAKSFLTATYSIFYPQDLKKTESAIEIFANSHAVFKHCQFYKAERVAVIIRNYSWATFEDCYFEDNKISVFIMDDSFAEFKNCTFKGDKNISVFVTKDSKAQLLNCEFNELDGKALFAKDSSKIYVKDTKFTNCSKGAATIAENSDLFLDGGIEVTSPDNTAVRAIKNSHVKAIDVNITNANGNAINIENSDGYFFNCKMVGTIHPTIAVIGRKANPIFYNCSLTDNNDTFCVISKNCSSPLFANCFFSGCGTNCFSVSDFSRPHIEKCTFEKIDGMYINAFSGSFVTYSNITSLDMKDDILFKKLRHSPSAKYKDVAYEKLNEHYEELSKQLNSDDAKDEEFDQEEVHVRSWRSPTYATPPEISENIKELSEILGKNAVQPLPQVKISQVINQVNDKDVTFICSDCKKVILLDDENDQESSQESEPDHDACSGPNIICPCGHILCAECAVKERKKCPICDSPIKDIKKIFFEDECMICMEKKPTTISIPCAHFCMCYECASKCSEMNFNCPMCNEPMNSYKYVFTDVEPKDDVTKLMLKSKSELDTYYDINKKSSYNVGNICIAKKRNGDPNVTYVVKTKQHEDTYTYQNGEKEEEHYFKMEVQFLSFANKQKLNYVNLANFVLPTPNDDGFIVTEFMEGGNLSYQMNIHYNNIATNYIINTTFQEYMDVTNDRTITNLKNKGELRIKRIDLNITNKLVILCGIAEIINVFHKSGIVIRNICPENILLDANSKPALCSLSFAKMIGKSTQNSRLDFKDSFLYVAPEIYNPGAKNNVNQDVFSFGALVIQLLTGKLQFKTKENKYKDALSMDNFNIMAEFTNVTNQSKYNVPDDLLSEIPENGNNEIQRQLDEWKEQFIELIKRCVSTKPEERPNFDEIVDMLTGKDLVIPKNTIDEFRKTYNGALHGLASRLISSARNHKSLDI